YSQRNCMLPADKVNVRHASIEGIIDAAGMNLRCYVGLTAQTHDYRIVIDSRPTDATTDRPGSDSDEYASLLQTIACSAHHAFMSASASDQGRWQALESRAPSRRRALMQVPRYAVSPSSAFMFFSGLPYSQGARLRLRLVDEVGVEV